MRVLVLDACRDNAFGGTRAVGGGLAPMQARGSLVAFATRANETASDNVAGANGLFTAELVRVLREPGLTLREIFYRVRERVDTASRGRQFPALYDELATDIVLRAPASTMTTAAPAPTPESNTVLRAELALWDAIKDSRSTAAFEDYLKRYPAGQFRVPADERFRAAGGRRAGETRSDPRVAGVHWAYVPAGTFEMGCTPGDTECDRDESPRHGVKLTRGFDLMTTEVTVAMVKERMIRQQPRYSRDDHPLVNMSRREAAAVCQYLSGRLPTEAEWEYAARGGAVERKYPWGNEPPVCAVGRPNGARFDDDASCNTKSTSTKGAVSVASYAPNGYGLYDMAGNVWEWVADWFAPYGSAEQTDPRGPASGLQQAMRGGSWYNRLPSDLRVSDRSVTMPDFHSFEIGFRCARDVSP